MGVSLTATPFYFLMASITPSSEATQKLEDQLTCPVCLDQFIDPRTLPCLHSFCIQCLKGLPLDPKRDDKYSLSCPTCCAEVDLPQQGVDAFHKAFHLNNLIEVHEMMKKMDISGGKSSECDHCKNVEAIGYCPQCNMFFCHSCNKIHKSWHQTSSHKLIGIDEVSSKTAQMVSVKPEPVINCSSHNRPLDIYCVSCDQPICYLCTIKDHKGHNHDLIPEAVQESKLIMKESLENLKQKIEEISRIKNKTEANLQQIEEKGEKVTKTISAYCDGVILGVQRAKRLTLQSITSGVQCKIRFEQKQLKTVNAFMEVLQYCKEHTEHSLRADKPIQLLMAKKQFMARLNTLVESDECDFIEPVEKEIEKDIQESTEAEVQKLVSETVNKITTDFFMVPLEYSSDFYEQCKVMPDMPESVTQSVESTASFVILFQGEAVLLDKSNIECSFKNDSDEIYCDVDYLIKDETVKYQVKFTVNNPGIYTFILKINDEEVEFEETYMTVLEA